MRYLLATVLLSASFMVQANPTTLYRALTHLGLDNKRIAKIAVKMKERITNQQFNKPFILITNKFDDVTTGYQFFAKKSGTIEIQKFEDHAGELSLGQLEVIDPTLTKQQLIAQRTKLLQLLQGVIDHNNNRRVADVYRGQPLPASTIAHRQKLLSALFSSKDDLTKIRYLLELLEVRAIDLAKLFHLSPEGVTIGKYLRGRVPHIRLDKHGINRRQALNELLHKRTRVVLSNSHEAQTVHVLIDNFYRIEKTATNKHQLLGLLLTDESLTDSQKIKHLSKILEVREADIAERLRLPKRSPTAGHYKNGRHIPHDGVDKYGVHRRYELRKLYHEQADASSFDVDDTNRMRDMIDEVFHTAKPPKD